MTVMNHLVTWLLAELDKACLVFIIAKIKLIDFAPDFSFFCCWVYIYFLIEVYFHQSRNLLPGGDFEIFLKRIQPLLFFSLLIVDENETRNSYKITITIFGNVYIRSISVILFHWKFSCVAVLQEKVNLLRKQNNPTV